MFSWKTLTSSQDFKPGNKEYHKKLLNIAQFLTTIPITK